VKAVAPLALLAALFLMSSQRGVAASAGTMVTATVRDGHKDFNFLFGTWRTHYRILRHRLSNSHDWYDCEGTSVIVPFWGGSGNLEDGDLHCPDRYVGGMTLRLYNADSHQWSLYFGTRKLGLVMPAQIGHFDSNGIGEFFANDTWKGRPIIVRFRWMLRGDSPRFEQAFSPDNGKTWETNWTTDYKRVPATTKGVWSATPGFKPGIQSSSKISLNSATPLRLCLLPLDRARYPHRRQASKSPISPHRPESTSATGCG